MASHFTWTFVLVAFALVLPLMVGQIGYAHSVANDTTFFQGEIQTVYDIDDVNLSPRSGFIKNTFSGLWIVLGVLPIWLSGIISTIYIVMLILITRQLIGFS